VILVSFFSGAFRFANTIELLKNKDRVTSVWCLGCGCEPNQKQIKKFLQKVSEKKTVEAIDLSGTHLDNAVDVVCSLVKEMCSGGIKFLGLKGTALGRNELETLYKALQEHKGDCIGCFKILLWFFY